MLNRENMIKTICIVLCILLVIGLAVVNVVEQKQLADRDAQMKQLEAKLLPYRTERSKLLTEISALNKDISYVPEKAQFMVGFIVSDVTDFAYIQQRVQLHKFTPIILLDCTKTADEIAALAECVQPSWEIMLYASNFSAENNEMVLQVKQYLKSIDKTDCGMFLIRSDYATQANFDLLIEDGFSGISLYRNPPACGQLEDGTVFFDYAYVKTKADGFTSRLSKICEKKAATVFAFDMHSVQSGAMTEAEVSRYLDILHTYATAEGSSYATASDVRKELSGINAYIAQTEEENAVKIAALQQRIDEIDRIIKDIYEQLEQ